MTLAEKDLMEGARERAYSMPLDEMDPADPELFRDNTLWPYFERLRKEEPVHYCTNNPYGKFWSVTKYNDIMSVDTNHKVFSSEASLGGISVRDQQEDFPLPMFIAMDPPKHDAQRKVVSPIVAPENLAKLEGIIRERVGQIFDGLPRNETFDWVDRVSIELTTQMLATLFDFPWEDRRKLTRWSDVATANENSDIVGSMEERQQELLECGAYFTELWNQRVNSEPGNDLISMMAHSEVTRDMPANEYLGNLILLIVGGNDTTRNSITGGLLALSETRINLQNFEQTRISFQASCRRSFAGRHRLRICAGRRSTMSSLATSRLKRVTAWSCGMCRATEMMR